MEIKNLNNNTFLKNIISKLVIKSKLKYNLFLIYIYLTNEFIF
jgi:hypothetical protein